MGAEPAGWEPCLLAVAFEGTHLIVYEHQIDAIPRLSAMNLKKKGAYAPFLILLSTCLLAQEDTTILNKEWCEYQAENCRQLDKDI